MVEVRSPDAVSLPPHGRLDPGGNDEGRRGVDDGNDRLGGRGKTHLPPPATTTER
jgi:hypothetical protein